MNIEKEKIKIAAKHSHLVYFDNKEATLFTEINISGYATKVFIGKEEYLLIAFAGSNNLEDWLDNFTFSKTKLGIHLGWYRSYRLIRSKLKNVLKDNKLPILVTGHSAGGALATIFSLFESKKSSIELYTFGSPKCLTEKHKKRLDARVVSSCRVTHYWDIVSELPIGDFVHVGKTVPIFWLGFPHFSYDYWMTCNKL